MPYRLFFLSLVFVLSACGSPAPRPVSTADYNAPRASVRSGAGQEVVLYALSLMDTGYRFGGKNPQAGLDCSGMVSYVFGQAAALKVEGSAADIAGKGRPVERNELRPGDLVFFNNGKQALSHVGIYIGDTRFVHAPSTSGKVRIDRLDSPYFAQRYQTARNFFD